VVGVFGGSGFYSLFEAFEEIEIETPYGASSAPVALGEIEGRKVAFMPRHGAHHELPPAQVPYRANVWAMREVGVTRLLGQPLADRFGRTLHAATSSSATSSSTAPRDGRTPTTRGRRRRTSPPPNRSAPISGGSSSSAQRS